MDERRPEPPAADPGLSKLSPLRRAWRDYTIHTAGCPRCRTRDGGRCEEAARLWTAHRELCDEAYAALAAQRASQAMNGR